MKQLVNIKSEIGVLKTILLHRPGEEFEALTPDYMEQLLFDDVPYLKVARKEHDAFAKLLTDNGVEVLYLDKLVEEALHTEELKWQFIREMVKASKQGGRRSTNSLIEYLGSMKTIDMIHKIMSGVRKNELNVPDPENKELHHFLVNDYPFYLDPMPNLCFTRDPAAAIGNGLTINKMHWPARRRESLLMEYIVNYHPQFRKADLGIWYDRDNRFSIEGGDILVLNSETVAVGISERTEAEAIEVMTTALLSGSDFKRVLAISIPKKRAFMHLDTVFTMIDHDKFSIHPKILHDGGYLDIYVLEKADTESGYFITKKHDLRKVLAEVLQKEIQLIECGGGDVIAASREQWNDGSNTLAIAPGVVVTYDRNHVTNKKMREAGIEVLEIAGSELSRGRGGPRCMSMPLYREDI